MVVIKKYSNRRLYDTELSRYITLDELAARVRAGGDVRVQDAKTGADLTQPTLAQIILESRGAARLLPTPLLVSLIRMDDHDLTEFLGKYMAWALQIYHQARRGVQAMMPFSPFNLFGMPTLGGFPSPPAYQAPFAPPLNASQPDFEPDDVAQELDEMPRAEKAEVARLREELAELKAVVLSGRERK